MWGALWYLANGSGGILLCRREMYRPPTGYGWYPMSRCDSGKRTYPSYAETLAALDRFAAKGILIGRSTRATSARGVAGGTFQVGDSRWLGAKVEGSQSGRSLSTRELDGEYAGQAGARCRGA
jgi:hypothetical protein